MPPPRVCVEQAGVEAHVTVVPDRTTQRHPCCTKDAVPNVAVDHEKSIAVVAFYAQCIGLDVAIKPELLDDDSIGGELQQFPIKTPGDGNAPGFGWVNSDRDPLVDDDGGLQFYIIR